MMLLLQITILLALGADLVSAHGYVSGIVANGVYTKGWQISYWYDLVNKVPVPASPGWYEEALDLGFIPPDQYQYAVSVP